MKQTVAIIKPFKLDELKDNLAANAFDQSEVDITADPEFHLSKTHR